TGNNTGDTTVRVELGDLKESATATVGCEVTIKSPVPAGTQSLSNQGGLAAQGIANVPSDDPDTSAPGDPTLTPLATAGGGAPFGGLAWNDANGNGIGEAGGGGLAGVGVKLLNGSGGIAATTVTGPSGSYSFTGLAAGNYAAEFVAQPGFAFSPQDQGGD